MLEFPALQLCFHHSSYYFRGGDKLCHCGLGWEDLWKPAVVM